MSAAWGRGRERGTGNREPGTGKSEGGFTLLEVMVALAILGLALTAISRSQQLSIRAANHAKLTTVATMLARY